MLQIFFTSGKILKYFYYREDFDVIAKPSPSNVAYSSGPLQLHTDLPYYEYKPGVGLFYYYIDRKSNCHKMYVIKFGQRVL